MIEHEGSITHYSCKIHKIKFVRDRFVRARQITGLLSIFLLAGCALFSTDSVITEETIQDAPVQVDASLAKDELIAIDLMNALMQIDGYHPQNTVVRLGSAQYGFGRALKTVLQSAGYALRIVDSSGGDNYMDYLVIAGPVEQNGSHFTYLVSIGDVKLKRQYFLQDQNVSPSSNLYIQGTDPNSIVLNDDVFSQSGPVPVGPNSIPEENGSPNTKNVIVATAPATDLPVTVSPGPRSAAIVIADAVSSTADPISETPVSDLPGLPVKKNMYELGQSNFTAVMQNYYDFQKQTLIFGNDSLRLGTENRVMLRDLVKEFSDRTDLLSVIGCSHGRTSLQNGNAVLATGRANRVKEALIHAGVPAERILEEGCWANEYFDEVMPRRGVVLTLKRKIKSS